VIGGGLDALRALAAPERPAAQALAVALWWQSTVLLALGVLGARVLRRRPARSHAVLCVALAASLLAPLATVAADRAGLGFWTASPAIPSRDAGSESEAQPSREAPALAVTTSVTTAIPTASPAQAPAPAGALGSPLAASPSAAAPLGGPALFAALWALLSLGVLATLLLAWRRTRRLLRAAAPCNDARLGLALRRVQQRLGVREVALLVSPEIRTPVLWGFGRPRLVLPADGAAAERAGIAWEPVLTHELAHLRRGDHRARLLGQLALVALPLQPLLWLARRELARSSEQACDDWALQDGAPAADYADSLLAFAAGPRASLAIGAVGRRGDLRERVARIVRAERVAPRAGRGFSIALLAGGALLLAGLACVQTRPGQAPETDASPIDLPATSTLAGRVVNKSGAPVARAKVSFWRDYLESPRTPAHDDWSSRHPQEVLTDADGRFELVGLRKGWVDLLVDHPDYARLFGPNGDNRPPTDRDDLVLVMHRGARVTGRVTGNGSPLAGAHVNVGLPNLAGQRIGLADSATTDAAGRFAIEHVFDDVGLTPIGPNFPDVTLTLRSDDWIAPHYQVQQPREGAELPFVEIAALPRTADSADESHAGVVRLGQPSSGEVARRSGESVGDATLSVRVDGPLRLETEGNRLRDIVLSGEAADGREIERWDYPREDGTVLFDLLPAGRYSVSTINVGSVVLPAQNVDLAAGERRDVVLAPGKAHVHGRVLCAGVPVGNGGLDVICLAAWSPERLGWSGLHVGEDGQWSVEGMPFGRYRMTWCSEDPKRPSGLVTEIVDVREEDVPFDFDLPCSSIEVRLADGSPLPPRLGLSVEASGSAPRGGNTGSNVTLTPEITTVEHVQPGRWTVRDHGGKLVGQCTVDGPDAKVSVVLDNNTHGRGLITGRVADWSAPGHGDAQADSSPFRKLVNEERAKAGKLPAEPSPFQLWAFAKDEHGLDTTRNYGEPEARPDGSFRITHLPDGRYGVLLMPNYNELPGQPDLQDDVPCLYAEATIANGSNADITLHCAPWRSVSFELAEGGSHLNRWRVAIGDEDWIPYSYFFGSDPRALHAMPGELPLTVGEHKVLYEHGDAPPKVVSFRVEPGDGVQTVKLGD
jgi:beta-lactamase regulating signal transducer with metallopeptidase domain